MNPLSTQAKVGAIIGIVVLLWAAILGIYFYGRSSAQKAQLQHTIETQKDVKKADDKASTTRVDDTVRTVNQAKELDNAITASDDPDTVRRLRGCTIMRQQGRDTSHVPGCGGSPGR